MMFKDLLPSGFKNFFHLITSLSLRARGKLSSACVGSGVL